MPKPTPDDVDALVSAMEVSLEKVDLSQKKMVKLRAAEADLLRQFETARDLMLKVLEDKDRTLLLELFGGSCTRIARIRAALEHVRFSAMYADDPRKQDCLNACLSVEAVLNDAGFGNQLSAAKNNAARVVAGREQKALEGNIEQANVVIEQLGICDPIQPMSIALPIGSLNSQTSKTPTASPSGGLSQGPGNSPTFFNTSVSSMGFGGVPVATPTASPLANGPPTLTQVSLPPGTPIGNSLANGPPVLSNVSVSSVRPGGIPVATPMESLCATGPPTISHVSLPAGTPIGSSLASGPPTLSHVVSLPSGTPAGNSASGDPPSLPYIASIPSGTLAGSPLATDPPAFPSASEAADGIPMEGPQATPVKYNPDGTPTADAEAASGLDGQPVVPSTPAASTPEGVAANALPKRIIRPLGPRHAEPIPVPSGISQIPSGAGYSSTGSQQPSLRPLRQPAQPAPAPVSPMRVPYQPMPMAVSPGHGFQPIQPVPAVQPVPVAKPVDPNKAIIVQLIQSGQLRQLAFTVFKQMAGTATCLKWNTREIPNFITRVFQELRLPVPQEGQMYSMYSRFDADGDWSLDEQECVSLVEMLCCELFDIEAKGQREQMASAVKSGEVAKLVDSNFMACDVNNNGTLEWNNGELRRFIVGVFLSMRLPVPSEPHRFAMFTRFDVNRDGCLDISECRHLVETLCRSVYQVEAADDATSCTWCGKVMGLFTTPTVGFQCGLCSSTFPTGTVMWQCQSCNKKVCVTCSKARRRHSTATGSVGRASFGAP
mmetsp:Transcript_102111/g.288371  ORF Transcript_102111/g.288371 Transcript_102111/m.288371 type:complete len:773 (-) Transcript_102111:179-2497(-)